MDIQFHGANCITVATGKIRVVFDDNLSDLGGKSVTKPGDLALFSSAHGGVKKDVKLLIDGPGEYETADVSVYGIPMRAHIDEAKDKSATSYKITAHDIRLLALGHVYPALSESQLEDVGIVDVLIVPVGGNGFTLDPTGAAELIKKIDPKIVIPTYYDDKDLKFPVPTQTLGQALQGLGMEPRERTAKLKVKPADLITDAVQLVVVEKS